MGYAKVDRSLEENGVAVDLFNDGTLFVKVRSGRSKLVEQTRTRIQAPYRNIIMANRPLPAGVQQEIARKVLAEAVIVGIAGTIDQDDAQRTTFGRIESGLPVEFAKPGTDELVAIVADYPDFGEDCSTAAYATATFVPAVAAVDANGEPAPTDEEATEAAAKN